MKKFWVRLLTVLFFLFLFLDQSTIVEGSVHGFYKKILRSQAAVEQPQVLIINAYHRGYGWTDSQTDAIIQAFEDSSLEPIYYIEYLDWKRQANQANLDIQIELLKHKYTNVDIDLILATDDIGMQFAIDHRNDLAPYAPIVFTGVFEASAALRMEGINNITGVYESIDPYGTMEMILELHPDLEHIYVINENSETGKDVEAEILAAVDYHTRKYGFTYETLNNHTYDEIDTILSNPAENSVAIIGTFNSDKEGEAIPNEVFARALADNTSIPYYSTYEYLYGHGIVGGSLLAGSLQGAKGAEIALDILGGTDINTIDEFTVKTVYHGIDHDYAKKHSIDYDILSEPYETMNRPVSVFETHRTVILTVLGIIVLLSFFIVILSINIRVRKKAQYELELKHEELYDTYESLASSDEELRVQNEELIEQQQEIHYLAFNDKLTSLPNRNAVESALKRLIDEGTSQQTMVMVIDLDNFNYINTAYGHRFGDELLKFLGKRLTKLHCKDCFVGRIAGDEFFLLQPLADVSEADILKKVDDAFEGPFMIKGKEIAISKSIGYTLFPDDGKTYDELLTRTDMAKKKMKQKGKGMTSRFVSTMNKEMTDRITLTKALKKAVTDEELYLAYQPQYDVVSKRIVGFETLVRWNSMMLGPIVPNVFIPLAEETGDIIDMGYFIMEEAFKFLAKYSDHLAPDFRLSINISVLQLLRQDFIERVKMMINKYSLNPKHMEFEITESILIESFDIVNERLLRLKLLGITIALDDFGTGYSSLTYLEKLPISTLKIDKAFIDGIIFEGSRHFFSKSIIDIAQKLGFRVVAEGVEETQQVDYLIECGSPIIQGYWYSKPLEEEAAIRLYIENREGWQG